MRACVCARCSVAELRTAMTTVPQDAFDAALSHLLANRAMELQDPEAWLTELRGVGLRPPAAFAARGVDEATLRDISQTDVLAQLRALTRAQVQAHFAEMMGRHIGEGGFEVFGAVETVQEAAGAHSLYGAQPCTFPV